MSSDPKMLLIALLGGMIPALLWLWFWLREDKENPEPKGVISTIFLVGMIAVILVIPLQKWIGANFSVRIEQLILWASAEEIIKYLVVMVLLYKTNHAEDPIDWPVLFITAGLGFAALENTLFLLKPLSAGQNTVGLLTGHLRFLGSTLLHAVASGIIGASIGLSMHMGKISRKIYLLFGGIFAITLHSVFNFFIMEEGGSNIKEVFGFLWVATIIMMLVFEKLRRMSY